MRGHQKTGGGGGRACPEAQKNARPLPAAPDTALPVTAAGESLQAVTAAPFDAPIFEVVSSFIHRQRLSYVHQGRRRAWIGGFPLSRLPGPRIPILRGDFGLIEFVRRLREDRLSVLAPEVFHRNLVYNRILFLHSFMVNKPEYIEHVLLTNQQNYVKSQLARTLLGPLLGNGLLLSEGAFWRRQRAIAAPAFQPKRIAGFLETMIAEAEAMAARWRERREPFDVAAEMMGLTLSIITRTMFSRDITGEIETVRQLMDEVVAQRPNLLDLFGLPRWLPRRHSKRYRAAVEAFDALVARIIAERRTQGIDHGDLLSMLLATTPCEGAAGFSHERRFRKFIIFSPDGSSIQPRFKR